jgi:hypothetical protein
MRDRGATRSVLYDTNYWKSFVAARLSSAMGDRGNMTLFGDQPQAHRMLADHLCSEFRVKTEARGRTVDEWKHRPERPDNHWLDCIVGATVAASMLGATLPESGATSTQRPAVPRVSWAELQRRARDRRQQQQQRR